MLPNGVLYSLQLSLASKLSCGTSRSKKGAAFLTLIKVRERELPCIQTWCGEGDLMKAKRRNAYPAGG